MGLFVKLPGQGTVRPWMLKGAGGDPQDCLQIYAMQGAAPIHAA